MVVYNYENFFLFTKKCYLFQIGKYEGYDFYGAKNPHIGENIEKGNSNKIYIVTLSPKKVIDSIHTVTLHDDNTVGYTHRVNSEDKESSDVIIIASYAKLLLMEIVEKYMIANKIKIDTEHHERMKEEALGFIKEAKDDKENPKPTKPKPTKKSKPKNKPSKNENKPSKNKTIPTIVSEAFENLSSPQEIEKSNEKIEEQELLLDVFTGKIDNLEESIKNNDNIFEVQEKVSDITETVKNINETLGILSNDDSVSSAGSFSPPPKVIQKFNDLSAQLNDSILMINDSVLSLPSPQKPSTLPSPQKPSTLPSPPKSSKISTSPVNVSQDDSLIFSPPPVNVSKDESSILDISEIVKSAKKAKEELQQFVETEKTSKSVISFQSESSVLDIPKDSSSNLDLDLDSSSSSSSSSLGPPPLNDSSSSMLDLTGMGVSRSKKALKRR
jgi:hypothetical protein